MKILFTQQERFEGLPEKSMKSNRTEALDPDRVKLIKGIFTNFFSYKCQFLYLYTILIQTCSQLTSELAQITQKKSGKLCSQSQNKDVTIRQTLTQLPRLHQSHASPIFFQTTNWLLFCLVYIFVYLIISFKLISHLHTYSSYSFILIFIL